LFSSLEDTDGTAALDHEGKGGHADSWPRAASAHGPVPASREMAVERPDEGRRRQVTGRVMLVCSPGGHLLELLWLEPAYRDLDVTWVTLASVDVEHLLGGRDVFLAHGPTNRSLGKLVRNLPCAWSLVRRRDPDVILATGAGLAVPFFLVGRLLKRRLVYVESLARAETLSLTGHLVYPLADRFYVQWPQLARRYRKARYAGSVLA
jgi:beta-1,4-N-acetylglucosaminyltransferase